MQRLRSALAQVSESGERNVPPVKGFLETSFVDWPGKVAAVIFLPGCNMRCRYCHNHSLVLRPERLPDVDLDDIISRLRRLKGWVDGVCITGGEPTLHPGLPSLARLIKREGFLVKLDTNGTRPGVLRHLLAQGLIDYVAMDVKSALEEVRYFTVCGRPANLRAIRESIELIKGLREHEFRMTALPHFHTEDEVYQLAWDLRGARRFTIQNFSPRDPMDAKLREAQPFDDEVLSRMRARTASIIQGFAGTA